MFRKPKRSVKAGLRKQPNKNGEEEEEDKKNLFSPSRSHNNNDAGDNEDEDDDIVTTRQELQEARKRNSNNKSQQPQKKVKSNDEESSSNVMHHFKADHNNNGIVTAADLATSTVQHHPKAISERGGTTRTTSTTTEEATTKPIKKRNPFLAGPIKAPTNIRTTCRFDYQPDICKDYKDTGFCGFGDTCIYLHDRGDTMTGWQLEQQWEKQQAIKKQQQEDQMNSFIQKSNGNNGGIGIGVDDSTTLLVDDGLPFACFLCRDAFTDPVVTNCSHYFCELCILSYVKEQQQQQQGGGGGDKCPICSKDTHRVFHQPTKLLAKRRRILGRRSSSSTKDEASSWKEFYDTLRPKEEE